ncbi:MAG TPA: HDOD domain-containing protein [Woeseiaceae bacterium]|nr:HDOD domain-containing protein [Woeseiaceae bacterium]
MAEKRKQRIGRYEVLRSIGHGSQGYVYLAHDPTLDRPVAIKVLTACDSGLNRLTEDGFSHEARISSRLRHPNIVPIFDAGECAAGPFLVFEYVEGKPLSQSLKDRGPLSVREAVPLFSAILQGVATAHAADIVHLDLSPRNILVDRDNRPRVMDFGLAQYVSLARPPEEYATGTLRYMAPEHFRCQPLGTWTDVFALGSSFFEIVTGERAMKGESIQEIQAMIIAGKVDFAALKSIEHGEEFARFLVGALEKSRDGRYANASDMKQAFDLFLEQSGLAGKSDMNGSGHGTIDFLLRRMQRTGDFPTISRTLSDINRLTSDDSSADADKLANVILRDFALTSKLLKLVNSAFYGVRASEITNISQAVVLLGAEKVRMTANSLTFFGQMKGDSAILKDSMIKSFLSGLLARHLATRDKLPVAEEAFICGMCQNLGENLVIFYFPDEHDDICELQASSKLEKLAAARGVLGVSYAELGAAVAKTWNLPPSIADAIRGVPPGALKPPKNDGEKLRDIAVFTNELCDVFFHCDGVDADSVVAALSERFSASIAVNAAYCRKLMTAGLERLKLYAPVFEVNVSKSAYCKALQKWADAGQQPEDLAVGVPSDRAVG